MVGFFDLFAPDALKGAGFPFGTPPEAQSGAPAWGTPPTPDKPIVTPPVPSTVPDPAINTGDPGLRRAYDDPNTPQPASAAPGGMQPSMLDKLMGNKDFTAAMGDIGGGLAAKAGQKAPEMSMPGPSNFDPSAASRQNAGKLLETIMAGKARPPVGGVPQLPPGLMQLFSGGRR